MPTQLKEACLKEKPTSEYVKDWASHRDARWPTPLGTGAAQIRRPVSGDSAL